MGVFCVHTYIHMYVSSVCSCWGTDNLYHGGYLFFTLCQQNLLNALKLKRAKQMMVRTMSVACTSLHPHCTYAPISILPYYHNASVLECHMYHKLSNYNNA